MVSKDVQMLPKESKEFAEQQYWADFFVESAKRSHEDSFEWYASFKDLKPFLQKLINEKSKVIVPGCGDSLLSEHVSLMGHSVMSFDFEPGVIQKMKQRPRSQVDYQVGDMYNMDYPASSYDCVLDKGSFDALCVDDGKETRQNVSKYCDGIKKIMKHDASGKSSFIMISLLQDFVFDQLLTNFTKEGSHPYHITVYVIHQPAMAGGSHFQRYCVDVRPSSELKLFVSESIDGKMREFSDCKSIQDFIKLDQVKNMIGPLQIEMKEFKKGQKFTVQTDRMIQGKPRYTLHVVDSELETNLINRNMGVFVVPQGCEKELKIDTYEAQNEISNQTQMSRLIIVVLGRKHKFVDLQQVQDELSPMVLDLCPKNCMNKTNIPYLTTRNRLHVREVVYQDMEVIVEDVVNSDRKGENDEPLTSR